MIRLLPNLLLAVCILVVGVSIAYTLGSFLGVAVLLAIIGWGWSHEIEQRP